MPPDLVLASCEVDVRNPDLERSIDVHGRVT